MKNRYHLVFAGGGLAAVLTAYRLAQRKRSLSILVVDQAPTLGGNHTWSFHDADLTADQHTWMAPLISKTWPGYDVIFPAFARTLETRYHALTSSDLHSRVLASQHFDVELEQPIQQIDARQITLANGRVIAADAVVDATGWEPSVEIPVAYQKFLGLHVRLRNAHGLTRPILMDARHEQSDGYRFFYVLPWSDTELLIEDTRYSESTELDEAAIREEIQRYATGRGWLILTEQRAETGVLPLPLGGERPRGAAGMPLIGTRAGLFHATTGYSLPSAVRFADAFAALPFFDARTLHPWTERYAAVHWKNDRTFRLLNRLVFRAARPEQRYKIFEKFYRHPVGTIERFYAGRLRKRDWLRLFSGRPPVPVVKALPWFFREPVAT